MKLTFKVYDKDEHRECDVEDVRVDGMGRIFWKTFPDGDTWQEVPEDGYIELVDIRITEENSDPKKRKKQ